MSPRPQPPPPWAQHPRPPRRSWHATQHRAGRGVATPQQQPTRLPSCTVRTGSMERSVTHLPPHLSLSLSLSRSLSLSLSISLNRSSPHPPSAPRTRPRPTSQASVKKPHKTAAGRVSNEAEPGGGPARHGVGTRAQQGRPASIHHSGAGERREERGSVSDARRRHGGERRRHAAPARGATPATPRNYSRRRERWERGQLAAGRGGGCAETSAVGAGGEGGGCRASLWARQSTGTSAAGTMHEARRGRGSTQLPSKVHTSILLNFAIMWKEICMVGSAGWGHPPGGAPNPSP